jgi:hypothetical protein
MGNYFRYSQKGFSFGLYLSCLARQEIPGW